MIERDTFEGDLEHALKDALIEDYCEYWALQKVARRVEGARPGVAERADALLLGWISSRQVVAGDLTVQGLRPWPLAPEETVAKVCHAIRQIAGEPTVGDVGWFTWVDSASSNEIA